MIKGTAKFKNPLPIPLSSGIFKVQGPGLENALEFILPNILKVNDEILFHFSMVPKDEGYAMIIAKFLSKELIASGSKRIKILN